MFSRALLLCFVIISALFLASCGTDKNVICTFEGGNITRDDVREMKEFGKAARREALYRAWLPVHAKKEGYGLSRKEQNDIWQGWLDDYYAGDEAALEKDAKAQKTTVEEVKKEILYQTLLDLFYERYPVDPDVTDAEAKAWYKDNPYSSGDNIDAAQIIFTDRAAAQKAYKALRGRTITNEQIRAEYPSALGLNITEWERPEVLKALEKLEVGEWSRPIFTPTGWQLYGVRSAVKQPYDIAYEDAKEVAIQDILQSRSRNMLIKEMKPYSPDCKG